MENSKRNLKISAIVVLIFTAFEVIQAILEIIFGEFSFADLSAGSYEYTMLIAKIVVFAVTFLSVIPRVYVGVKGLKVAKSPDGSKGHIIWAGILLAITVILLAYPIMGMINKDDESNNVGSLFALIVDITVYIEFIVYAQTVAREG